MKRRLLSLLRVSERPDPPPGSGDSLDVFRASRGELQYSWLRWGARQASTLLGIVVSLALFSSIGQALLREFNVSLGPVRLNAATTVGLLEIGAIVAFVVQFIVTGALVKLSWELRWYMVGEEALRIREGLWSLKEQTMTIANIQNMIVRQGPIQQLFGIANLEVHTAGGGARASSDDDGETKGGIHVGLFRGIEDASGLRDRIHARLVQTRGTGLGDAHDVPQIPRGSTSHETLAAARAVLDEVRALRQLGLRR